MLEFLAARANFTQPHGEHCPKIQQAQTVSDFLFLPASYKSTPLLFLLPKKGHLSRNSGAVCQLGFRSRFGRAASNGKASQPCVAHPSVLNKLGGSGYMFGDNLCMVCANFPTYNNFKTQQSPVLTSKYLGRLVV